MRTHRPVPRLMLVALMGAAPALVSSPPPALAGGLRCSIGEVVIENLKIGHPYSLKQLANLPLNVTNTTDGPVTLRVEALAPDASELRQGAEAIPSAAWASVSPDSFDMAAAETRAVELSLAIPDDEALLGRKFQVEFCSHTLPRPGDLLSYGLKSRVIFTIDPSRDTTSQNPQGDLSLEFVPAELWLDRVSKGKDYRLVSHEGQTLSLRNTSDHEVTVRLRAVPRDRSASAVVKGFDDLLASGQVEFSPDTITLAPRETRSLDGRVRMGKPKGHWTSNLACVISAEVVDQPVRTQLYARVYARTQ